jgi:2-polyprenyl-3-methyl-5-hydroxy-6-metoxy-1,4-benzoquinol methylase
VPRASPKDSKVNVRPVLAEDVARKTRLRDVPPFYASASRKIRTVVKSLFIDAFASLPFNKSEELKILDVGCGLGFLSCVSAEFYANARVYGD